MAHRQRARVFGRGRGPHSLSQGAESLENGTPATRVFGRGRGPPFSPSLTRRRSLWRMAHRQRESLGEEGVPILSRSHKAQESLENGTPATRVFGRRGPPFSLSLSLSLSQGAGVFGEWHTGNGSLWERKGPRSLSFSQGAGVFGEWHTGNESLWERKGSPFSLPHKAQVPLVNGTPATRERRGPQRRRSL